MTAGELYKAGKLQAALDAQVAEVKTHPGDQSKRLFLFELLCFAGELEKARRHIEALDFTEPELVAAAQHYRKLLDSEQLRRRLFNDGHKPEFLVPPPPQVQHRLTAIDHLRGHRPADAAAELDKAAAAAEPFSGKLNDKPFTALRDCDDLFGSVLEVMSQGKYYWVPLEQVETLSMNPPRFPRDLIWRPADLELKSGTAGDAFLPALYPHSAAHADEQVRLGRVTDWQSENGGPVLGVGARMFLADDDAVPFLEWRTYQSG